MKRSIIAIAALLSLITATDCLAVRRPLPGPYLSGFFGVSAPVDTDVTSSDVTGTFHDRAEFDPNINVGATAGYDFVPLRLEGELSYKHGEFSTITDRDTGAEFVDADGRVGALAVLLNAFIDLHNASIITPYLGGGFGFAAVHLSDTSAVLVPVGQRVALYDSDDDTVFAYQAGAGIGVALNPQITLDIGYRYFGTSDADFYGPFVHTTLKVESHNAAVGIRVKF